MDLFIRANGILLCLQNRGVEQLVARWAHNPKVTGSSPVPATTRPSKCRFLASFGGFLLPEFSARKGVGREMP